MLMRTKTRRMLHLLKQYLMYSTMGLPSTTIRGMMIQHTGGFAEESSN